MRTITLRCLRSTFAFGLILALGACAHRATELWDARIGAFTFDDAVLELGPPDKSAVLSDGSTVAEWLHRRANYNVVGFSHGYYGRSWGIDHSYAYPSGGDWYLSLLFDSNDTLSDWKYVSR